MNNKLVYTVNFGGKDKPKPARITSRWDYLAITDDLVEYEYPWRVERINTQGQDIRLLSRKYKILGQDYFANYDTVVYCDASYAPFGNLNDFIEDMKEGVWMTQHPRRNCLYREAQVVIGKMLDKPEVVLEQIGRYLDEGYPKDNGLYRCGCIVRNRGFSDTFNEHWFNEVSRGTWRDQVAAPYSAKTTCTQINKIPHGWVEKHFKLHLHEPFPLEQKIITLDDPSKIKQVGKENWIQLLDEGKTESKYDVQAAIREYPLFHLICTPDAYLFPRWLWDYLFDRDKLEDYVLFYQGKLAYWSILKGDNTLEGNMLDGDEK